MRVLGAAAVISILCLGCKPKNWDAEGPVTDGGGDTATSGGGGTDTATDDSGTDDSGTDDSGTDDSGTDDSGTDDSGTDDSGSGPVDADGDGFTADEDCDDDDATVNPDATETCNEVDDDCDGDIDEELTSTFYDDGDGDGFGDADSATSACEAPSGTVADATDCDDADPSVNPDAAEVCNEVDDDCDGAVDEDVTTTFYDDADGDGYGDADASTDACEAPSGTVADATDCDDGAASIHPDAEEVCNEIDDDCDGLVDDDDPDVSDASTWYADDDGDGFGDADDASTACEAPSGTVADATDCDDTDADVSPDGTEACNEVDDDCDGDVDEGVTSTFYADADGDGYGDADDTTDACEAASGTVADATDCDDTDATVNPGAEETCNGTDDDCDGTTSWLEDDPDGDGTLACDQALWLRNDSYSNVDPEGTDSYSATEAAALLSGLGIDWDSSDTSATAVDADTLSAYGTLVFYGRGTYGALDATESAALEDWVEAGGGLLYMGYHPSAYTCDEVNSLPTSFGLSCSEDSAYWGGVADGVSSHDVTDGVSDVSGQGGEYWDLASPASAVVTIDGEAVVVVAEVGDGRLVGISDEWMFYDSGLNASYDISAGDHATLIENVFVWLSEW